jgi:hypothetical protein
VVNGVDKILVLVSRPLPPEDGKSVHVLHSRMSVLDYMVEPKVECSFDDPNNVAFVQATTTIGGRDAVEEFVACKMFPRDFGFSFRNVPISMMPVLGVRTPLPLFPVKPVSLEDISHVLAEVETDAERFLGSFGSREYDVVMAAKLPNGGHLNHVFEKMGVTYAPRPLPGSEASQAARDEQKAEVSRKPIAKKAKIDADRAAPSRTVPAPS